RGASHRLSHGGAGRRGGVQPHARGARGAAAVGARAGRGREPPPEHRQRGHDCPRGLAPPRVGRAQRLDPRRQSGPSASWPGACGQSAIHNPKSAIPMTIYPLMFRLGPLTITGYGIMMMVAFLMAGWAIQVDLRRRGMNEDYAADIVFAAVVGGIVGAKIWYVLLTGEWDALLRRGGFVWYGGFLGGAVGVLVNGWRRRVPTRWTAELAAAPAALGYALGRVGCFVVNDDYGIRSSLPWAMKFPEGLPPTTVENLQRLHVTFPPNVNPADVVAVHPTQIYET